MNRDITSNINSINKAIRTKSQEAYDAKMQARELRREKRAIQGEFIGAAFDEFLEHMNSQNYYLGKEAYIAGRYTGTFTKYVNRTIPINMEHNEAIHAFNEALKNLNKVFVDQILANPDRARHRLMELAGLKNLNELED